MATFGRRVVALNVGGQGGARVTINLPKVAKLVEADSEKREGLMTRVLFVGEDPETVDFTDPALPPGMSMEKVLAGIEFAMKEFAARGWEADLGLIRPDETAGPTVERLLGSKRYNCVVIGGGVRLPPRRLPIRSRHQRHSQSRPRRHDCLQYPA